MNSLEINLLTETQARQLFQEELGKFFASNPIKVEPEEQSQKVVDLDGLLKARPFIGSRSTIYKKVSSGLIPHSKQGKRLIFDLNVIDQWLLSNQIKTTDEIELEAVK